MSKEGFIRGRVSFGAREEYRVLLEGGEETLAEPSGVLRAYGELPTVGDWVQVRRVSEFCLIEEVEPRKTAFIRRATGRAHASQCVAANIDICFIVCGLDGDFNLRRIERFLVLARESGAHPVVVLNKEDLCVDLAAALDAVRTVCAGAEIVAISAQHCVEPLRRWLRPGATAALLGSSGVGKSTIANALSGGTLATGDVREHDSRGRHTTTARMLIAIPGGAWLIDTPGMRELGVLSGEISLDSGFPEIAALAAHCRFRDCRHDEEPGCAIRGALAEGKIPADRWISYAKLQREAHRYALEADAAAQRAEKQKWKAMHRANKRMYRERGR